MKNSKLLALIRRLIKPFVSRSFWYQLLFITCCTIFNIIMFQYLFKDIPKSWIWFTGWVHCIIYYAIFKRR